MDERYNEFHMHVILILRSHLIHSQPIKEVNLKAEVFLVITELQFYLNLWASILSVKFTAFRIQNLDKKFMKISVPICFFKNLQYTIFFRSFHTNVSVCTIQFDGSFFVNDGNVSKLQLCSI